jgi:hypothetical protein
VFCKCFRRMLQVFQLFGMYIAIVSSRCCKNRLRVGHVAMRVRSGGGASGPCARSGDAGVVRAARTPHGRAKCRLRVGACWPECGKREYSVGVRSDVRTLAPLIFVPCFLYLRKTTKDYKEHYRTWIRSSRIACKTDGPVFG